MATNDSTINNTYEEARKQRLQENKKRFQDLGILGISKSLSDLTNSDKKSKQRLPKPKAGKSTEAFEPRRSSRARNPVPSYFDDVDIGLPPMRKRSGSKSWESYLSRPIDEVKLASYEDRIRALKAAEEFQSSLESGNPSFVKSMVRSHVYSCFWLGLPTQFCKHHLPEKDVDMILVDENGSEYDAKYIGRRVGLSGGWRGFALDHKLDDGDAVVFELVEPDRFKVYTFRVSSTTSTIIANNEMKDCAKPDLHSRQMQKSKKAKIEEKTELSDTQNSQQEDETADEGMLEDANIIDKNGLVSKQQTNKGKFANGRKLEEGQIVKDEEEHAGSRVCRPRKKTAARLFRKRA